MHSSSLTPTSILPIPPSWKAFPYTKPNSVHYTRKFKLNKEIKTRLLLSNSKNTRFRNPKFSNSCLAVVEEEYAVSGGGKIRRLASEFKSLTEPIDRVKRLLHYANRLPPLDESARVPSNRVTGCTAEMWLEVKMDERGRMRFGADSDSEIIKGFCSCLISVFDGLEPEEVVAVKPEDLAEMNVGLSGRTEPSRVNAWHNVMISMQKRTIALIAEREKQEKEKNRKKMMKKKKQPSLPPPSVVLVFPSLVVNGISTGPFTDLWIASSQQDDYPRTYRSDFFYSSESGKSFFNKKS